eukprot:16431386-Heterocapsa_arctica.AAC.1
MPERRREAALPTHLGSLPAISALWNHAVATRLRNQQKLMTAWCAYCLWGQDTSTSDGNYAPTHAYEQKLS